MKTISKLLMAGALSLALAGGASAQGFLTNGLPLAGSSNFPTTLPLTGSERIPADTQLSGGAQPQSEAVTTGQIAAMVMGRAGSSGIRNMLIGGDFNTNLWQRGTTSGTITSTLTYSPDRWWALGAAGSAIVVSKQTGASDITTGFAASARVARTAANTDVNPICFGQVLSSANTYLAQGQVVEFSFSALAGATFSPASSIITVTIGSGTGADGTAANFSTGSWTGYSALVAQATTISTTWGRYSAIATVPAASAQLGVKVCWTPVGTAGATDYVEFGDMQLAVNPSAVANTGATNSAYSISTFDRRPASLEASFQYHYLYVLTETNGAYFAPGMVSASNVERAVLYYPVPMRTTPTCTFTAGGFKWDLNGTDTAVGTLTQVTGSTAYNLTIGDTTTATVGWTAFLFGSATTGSISCSAEL